MNIIRNSCLRIPFSFVNEEWVRDILKFLTRTVVEYTDEDKESKIHFYEEDPQTKTFLIPRFFKIGFYNTEIKSIENQIDDGIDIDITHNITPKNNLQKEAMDWYTKNNFGILNLMAGEGKTVITIWAMAYYKKKTIILVHKDGLAEQWTQRIKTFTNLKDEDIARLTTDKYEKCLSKPIVIATVQTICAMRKKFGSYQLFEMFKRARFGMMVADEVHTIVGPEKFSTASLHITTPRSYGLSATPNRVQNEDMLTMHLGPIYRPFSTDSQTMEPKIHVLKFDHGIMTNIKKKCYICWNNKNNKPDFENGFDETKYLKQVIASKRYQSIVKGLIINKIYPAKRRLVFLANRIAILDWASSVIPNTDLVGFYLPRTEKTHGKGQREQHLKRQFIFSTYGSFRDGIDVPQQDCLIMATRTSNVNQTIGRVIRPFPNKKQPLVFDIVDTTCPEMIKKYNVSKTYYEQKNWEVLEHTLTKF